MISGHVFHQRAFTLFWTGKFLTTIATLTQNIAIGWQVYNVARLTHTIRESSFLVGMVGLAQFLPLFALVLIAGETADRYERRVVLLGCTILQFCSATALVLQSLSPAPSLTGLFFTAAFIGVSRAFSMPAGNALAPTLVPPSLLPQAVAWNTLSTQGGMVLGPWLGGLLCAVAPVWAYGFAATLYLTAGLVALALLAMKLDVRPKHSGASRLTMIREGLHYLWHSKIVLGAISLDLFAVFLGGATALLPVFARDILHIGADGFGLLRSGPALGAGIVTLILSVRPIKRHAGPWMLLAVIVFGVATVVFALSQWLWLSLIMLATLGAADSISVFVRQSLVQIVTPNPMRGRVAAVASLFISASNELGEFESGVAARLLGPIGSVIFGGVGSIAVTVLWAKLFPALRKADRLLPPEM
jgi:MFS family permease